MQCRLGLWRSFMKSHMMSWCCHQGCLVSGLRLHIFSRNPHINPKRGDWKTWVFTRQRESNKRSYWIALWEMQAQVLFGAWSIREAKSQNISGSAALFLTILCLLGNVISCREVGENIARQHDVSRQPVEMPGSHYSRQEIVQHKTPNKTTTCFHTTNFVRIKQKI